MMIIFYCVVSAHILIISSSDFMLFVSFSCFIVESDSRRCSIVFKCSMDKLSVVKDMIQFTVIVSSLEHSLYVLTSLRVVF